jgi:hypothetical protein
MYTGSGLGAGGAAGAALAGVAAAAATGRVDGTVAGLDDDGAAAASDSPLTAARRSFERFSRCSGISVTGILCRADGTRTSADFYVSSL